MSAYFNPTDWAPRNEKEQAVIIIRDNDIANDEWFTHDSVNDKWYGTRTTHHILVDAAGEFPVKHLHNGHIEYIDDVYSMSDAIRWVADSIQRGELNTAKGTSKRPIVVFSGVGNESLVDAAKYFMAQSRASKVFRVVCVEDSKAADILEGIKTVASFIPDNATCVMWLGKEYFRDTLLPHVNRVGQPNAIMASVDCLLAFITGQHCVVCEQADLED